MPSSILISFVGTLTSKCSGFSKGDEIPVKLWYRACLKNRKPAKNRTQPPEDVETFHNASVVARFDIIKGEGKEIHKLMKDTVDNVRPANKKSIEWLSYVDYVNGLVIEGITNGIDSSMTYLAEQISI